MSEKLDQFLASQELKHHGVKGMKWGKRQDRGHEGKTARTSKIDKLDKKFEKKASSTKTTFAIYDKAAAAMNGGEIARINAKPEYKNVNVYEDTPQSRKYIKEYQDTLMKHLNSAAKDLGTNASGTKSYEVVVNGDSWAVRTKDLQHADDDLVFYPLIEDGLIVGFETDDELSHYGVPGMRWGKRKAGDSSAPSDRQVKRQQYKTDLKSGREAQKAGRELTDAQSSALRTNGRRKIGAMLATYGALQIAGYAGGKIAGAQLSKQFEAAATAGAQANNASLKQIGDLSTFVLRKGANGSWG